uniref:Uncharacterized protein n=1 Tax=Chromera velia CCMP2878 TaxID=1169474 RepID=A0A0G4HZA4_9ALVE|eukprot:Cvel_33870.t1-p1 / transcript=Cvel_33870.t1 / gene=Cvel_33870 / organism=Chromera_velia_CCMP2878 / gene_product=Rab9 effector protein with kelch motifs, putative / transcript_product=Rab9 effector protein with kelch motifs, putative / location=Cvel_scaffold5639:1180-3117(-) / protein_length=646 / sequence_SO=supercontig / SO=protein_coding / is_pseudo=false
MQFGKDCPTKRISSFSPTKRFGQTVTENSGEFPSDTSAVSSNAAADAVSSAQPLSADDVFDDGTMFKVMRFNDGPSLYTSMQMSKAWHQASSFNGGLAYRQLTYSPDDSCLPFSRTRASEVAFARRTAGDDAESLRKNFSWKSLAKAHVSPSSVRSAWYKVGVDVEAQEKPICHRHSMAVAPAFPNPTQPSDTDSVLLYGGNVTKTVAGYWRCSSGLYLARLPDKIGGRVSCRLLSGHHNWRHPSSLSPSEKGEAETWPYPTWGSALAASGGGHVLVGGWQDYAYRGAFQRPALHRLWMREAGVEWAPVSFLEADVGSPTWIGPAPYTPWANAAFLTATSLGDNKTVAVAGGLSGSGSVGSLVLLRAEENRPMRIMRQWMHDDGAPIIAGHCAGFACGRLALFGGVTRGAGPLQDRFSNRVSYFDIRMQQWVDPPTPCGPVPAPRRNAMYATVGRHLLISGGWDDVERRCFTDTWALDIRSQQWTCLSSASGGNCTPAPDLEAHKGVASGYDVFSFGGHRSVGEYSSKRMVVHVLSLGVGEDEKLRWEGGTRDLSSDEEEESEEEEVEEDEDEDEDEEEEESEDEEEGEEQKADQDEDEEEGEREEYEEPSEDEDEGEDEFEEEEEGEGRKEENEEEQGGTREDEE